MYNKVMITILCYSSFIFGCIPFVFISLYSIINVIKDKKYDEISLFISIMFCIFLIFIITGDISIVFK